MSLIVVSDSKLRPSVVRVVRFGAMCESNDENPYVYVPEFYYELPVLSPQVMIDLERTETEGNTKTDDPTADTTRGSPRWRLRLSTPTARMPTEPLWAALEPRRPPAGSLPCHRLICGASEIAQNRPRRLQVFRAVAPIGRGCRTQRVGSA